MVVYIGWLYTRYKTKKESNISVVYLYQKHLISNNICFRRTYIPVFDEGQHGARRVHK